MTAYERFAAFDGVVAEANGGFGIVLLGDVARRFDVLRIEENTVKREVIRLLVEMRREQAQIKETVSVWVATLEGMQREGSSYSDILAYRSKALAACSIPNARSFDSALTTVFPNFVAPVDDTPNAHAEAYLLCRLRATYSEAELQTRVRLSLAGAGFMRALGVIVYMGCETKDEAAALKRSTEAAKHYVAAKFILSESALRTWGDENAVEAVLSSGAFIGGFGALPLPPPPHHAVSLVAPSFPK